MSAAGLPPEESAEELFEEAPCGYVTTRLDGTILRVNRTFERWTGLDRAGLLGARRFQDLLSPGGRIYHETHVAPLLRMQGAVREIAVELVGADGTRLPALITSVVRPDAEGRPQTVRTTVFDATDRRRYEQELMRARRREQEVAQHLQRSLLAGRLPSAPGLAVEVAYHPAVRGLEVGGDWYDAFWADEPSTAWLVVGDIVGRGVEAAATMGQLRSAVRALASTGVGPAGLLDGLDAYARRHDVGRMATLVCARVALEPLELRYACAGHPPPLLVPPEGEPELLWGGRSLPLDVRAREPAPREEAALEPAPGSTLLLYTDGLVERRTRALADGIDALVTAVCDRRDEPLAGLAAGLARALQDPEPLDDVCLLAARLGT